MMIINWILSAAVGFVAIAGIATVLFALEDHRVWERLGSFMGWLITVTVLAGLAVGILRSLTATIIASAGIVAWAIFKTSQRR